MKGFFPDQSDHGAVTPFEYLPCGAITPKAGLALVLTNGLLALATGTTAPTYMEHHIHLVLAEDLYPERLPGDEPEELEVVPWKFDALHELMLREDCSEGRSLAALFIVREVLEGRA